MVLFFPLFFSNAKFFSSFITAVGTRANYGKFVAIEWHTKASDKII